MKAQLVGNKVAPNTDSHKVEVASPTDSQAKYAKEAADKLEAANGMAEADAGAGAVAMDPEGQGEEGAREEGGVHLGSSSQPREK